MLCVGSMIYESIPYRLPIGSTEFEWYRHLKRLHLRTEDQACYVTIQGMTKERTAAFVILLLRLAVDWEQESATGRSPLYLCVTDAERQGLSRFFDAVKPRPGERIALQRFRELFAGMRAQAIPRSASP